MIRALLEKKYGTLQEWEYSLAMDMATQDIVANRRRFNKKSTLQYTVGIVEASVEMIKKYNLGG
jgi:hypothetical protein